MGMGRSRRAAGGYDEKAPPKETRGALRDNCSLVKLRDPRERVMGCSLAGRAPDC